MRSILLTLLKVFLASGGLGLGSSLGSLGAAGALLAMVASPGSLAMLGAKAVAVAAGTSGITCSGPAAVSTHPAVATEAVAVRSSLSSRIVLKDPGKPLSPDIGRRRLRRRRGSGSERRRGAHQRADRCLHAPQHQPSSTQPTGRPHAGEQLAAAGRMEYAEDPPTHVERYGVLFIGMSAAQSEERQ
ncbi:hypothetical protein EYF80_057379 [Liparis tanakae]|uniref:Uncharacterized protein n=1 Tax=Liparis tanakae TaxID=230148 RepID=A0A4Z2EUY1_9TELE|nr:hypothetical protein EYF80_057379 [Liparis tanakae]